MALASVTREQFEIRSDVEVVHIPTGADFRAYPYSNPDDMLQSVKVSWGRDGGPAESTGDYTEQVRRMASHLLLERIKRPEVGDWTILLENVCARSTIGLNTRQHNGERYEREPNTTSQVGALDTRDISKKAISFAERNVPSAFEFAQKIAQTQDIQEMGRMQTEFLQSQMQPWSSR